MKGITRKNRTYAGRLAGCVIVVVTFSLGRTGVVQGQTSRPGSDPGSQSIRRSAEEILASPEFRRFKRLEPREKRFDSKRGSGRSFPGGEGSGSSDGGEGPNGQSGADGDGGGGNSNGSSESSGGQTNPASSSGSVPIGGALAGLGMLFHLIAWMLLAVVVGFIIFLIAKAFQNYEGTHRPSELTGDADLQGDVEPERPPGELPADAYLAEAHRLAAAGEYREAVAQLLLGSMSFVERAGLIRYRRGLTYRDYLRAIRSQQSLYEAMRSIVRLYEPLGFGRRTPSPEHYQRSLSRYESAFLEVPTGERPA